MAEENQNNSTAASRKRTPSSSLLFTPSDSGHSQQLIIASSDVDSHPSSGEHSGSKKRKLENAIVLRDEKNQDTVFTGIKRTSSMLAPIMLLEGHLGEIYSCKFAPKTGALLATGSFDRFILLWKTNGKCESVCALRGHFGPVSQIEWSHDGQVLYSSSADKSVIAWDVAKQRRLDKFKHHSAVVNCVASAANGLLVSGSDDRTAQLIDPRDQSISVRSFDCTYPVLSVAMHSSNHQLYTSGIDNVIKVWDMRSGDMPLDELKGHFDSVTGIALSPDENYLLSNSMDNSLRVWDMRPYAKQPDNRCTKMLYGHRHGLDKSLLRCSWSSNGKLVACGSSDSPTHVFVWDLVSTKQGSLLYKLPGHKGTVHDVAFHPVEPIVASCSSDKTVYLGELQLDG